MLINYAVTLTALSQKETIETIETIEKYQFKIN